MGYMHVFERSIRLEIVLAGFLLLLFCIIVLIAIALHQKERIELINAERQKLGKEKCDINNQLIQTRAENRTLKGDLACVRQEKKQLEDKNKEYLELLLDTEREYETDQQCRDKALANKQNMEKIRQDMLENPCSYFFVKDTVYGSKQEMNLLGYLDTLVYKKSTSTAKYTILPQVSLHAYIRPKANLSNMEKSVALELVGGKNTDFLICRTIFGNASQAPEVLRPIIAVEINGDQHGTNYKTIKNDTIKENLFRGLGIPLVSHWLGSGEKIQNEVAPYLE